MKTCVRFKPEPSPHSWQSSVPYVRTGNPFFTISQNFVISRCSILTGIIYTKFITKTWHIPLVSLHSSSLDRIQQHGSLIRTASIFGQAKYLEQFGRSEQLQLIKVSGYWLRHAYNTRSLLHHLLMLIAVVVNHLASATLLNCISNLARTDISIASHYNHCILWIGLLCNCIVTK